MSNDDKAAESREAPAPEEQSRPKATLIKRKPEPPPVVETQPRPEAERRRIIVVKKQRKTVVVKRRRPAREPVPEPPPAASPTPDEQPPAPAEPARPAAVTPGEAPQPHDRSRRPAADAPRPDRPDKPAADKPAVDPPPRQQASPPQPAAGAPPAVDAAPRPAAGPPAPARTPAGPAGRRPSSRPRGTDSPRRLTTPAARIRAAEAPLRPIARARDSDQPLPDTRDRFRRRPSSSGPSGRGNDRPAARRPPPRSTAPGRPPVGRAAPGAVREAPPGRGRPAVARGTGRPSPARNGAPETPLTDGRTGGRKFFRTRRRSNLGYQIGPEEHQEKLTLAKKKAVPVANPVPKEIDILEAITVSELARKLNLKASDLIAKLMGMGTMVTINQQIDSDTATLLAEEFGSKVNVVSLFDETVIEEDEDPDDQMVSRPPIVTIMGHVDHGKTKLLDAIRETNVAEGEAGGITQHIGAYSVATERGRISFLDTPGHAAFTEMRARGAQLTDIVVLVVAADDGLMPQTVEATNHAKAAAVPIIVAVNKIDLPDANPDRVRQQLSDFDLIPEEWGGATLFTEISALRGDGIDVLLENILLQAELLELKANYEARAVGRVVESQVDLGRGIVATVMIQKGTLRTGDSFVAGVYSGKVRAMFDDRGERIAAATPAQPVQIVGLTGLPKAGDPFQATENEKTARQVGTKRQELKKVEEAQNITKVTLDNLYEQISEGDVQELKLIIKGDVHGSVEALRGALERLSTNEIKLSVIHSAAGAVNKDDVALASASNAIIIGFHIRATPNAQAMADREKVEIRKYDIIYEVIDDIRDAMEGLLAPEIVEDTIGTVEVRELFRISRVGTVAGSYVVSGAARRGATGQIVRDGRPLFRGRIVTLRRFKDDTREVDAGYECGIRIEGFNDVKVGDLIEVLEQRAVAKKLGAPTAELAAASGAGSPRTRSHVATPAQEG